MSKISGWGNSQEIGPLTFYRWLLGNCDKEGSFKYLQLLLAVGRHIFGITILLEKKRTYVCPRVNYNGAQSLGWIVTLQ